jgi:hypothetical protein
MPPFHKPESPRSLALFYIFAALADPFGLPGKMKCSRQRGSYDSPGILTGLSNDAGSPLINRWENNARLPQEQYDIHQVNAYYFASFYLNAKNNNTMVNALRTTNTIASCGRDGRGFHTR